MGPWGVHRLVGSWTCTHVHACAMHSRALKFICTAIASACNSPGRYRFSIGTSQCLRSALHRSTIMSAENNPKHSQ